MQRGERCIWPQLSCRVTVSHEHMKHTQPSRLDFDYL